MERHKYPRTPHLPFSRSWTGDDRVLRSLDHFVGKEIVVTKKMDGENTSLYRDGFHARSIDSRHHPSRDWVAAFHAGLSMDIPEGWRICGENLYARHSLGYVGLPSYFMGFSVWSDENVALSWDHTLERLAALGIVAAPEIHRGVFNEGALKKLAKDWDTEIDEGFVVRLAGPVAFGDFESSFAKWVRQRHVQTNDHWMSQAIVPNKLAPR